jgi:hypothetical protein
LPVEKLDGFGQSPHRRQARSAFQEGVITSPALRAAIRAMGQSRSPAHCSQTIRQAKIWQEKTKWFATAAALFVVGALGAGASWYLNDYVYEQAAPVRSEYQQKYAQAKRLAGQWQQEVEGMGKDDRDKLLSINALQEYRDLWPTLMNQFAGNRPHRQPAAAQGHQRRTASKSLSIASPRHGPTSARCSSARREYVNTWARMSPWVKWPRRSNP